MDRKTRVHAFEIDPAFGIIGFHPNGDLPGLEERRTNELFDVFNIVARQMAVTEFYGTAEIDIENGKYAGKKLSISISLT